MGKNKKRITDKNLIQTCILRSRYIILGQSAQHANKEILYFINGIPGNIPLPSKECLPELDKEISVALHGLKTDIANFLRPILHAQDIAIKDKFWFSSYDLEQGYVQFSTRNMSKFDIVNRVLLLTDVFIDNVKQHSMGDIVTWMEFNKIKEFVEGTPNIKTFRIHYALRTKNRKNGKQ